MERQKLPTGLPVVGRKPQKEYRSPQDRLEAGIVGLHEIENWHRRNGPDGKDKAEDFNKSKFARYQTVAPDCMGPWRVYWRQCMPGLDNKSVDNQGRPMKNWWVFLFY